MYVEVVLHLLDHLEVLLRAGDRVLDLDHRGLNLRGEHGGGGLGVVELLLDKLLRLDDGGVVCLEPVLERLEHLLHLVLVDHRVRGVFGDVALQLVGQHLLDIVAHLVECWARVQLVADELRAVQHVVGRRGQGGEASVVVPKLLVCPEAHVVGRSSGARYIASDIGPWRSRVHGRGR